MVTRRRREYLGCGLPTDVVYSLGIMSLSMSLVSGLDVEGSRTVAWTPAGQIFGPLADARAAFERLSARTRAVLQRVRFTFADATAMDYAVNVDGLDPLSAARRFMDERSDDVRPWFG